MIENERTEKVVYINGMQCFSGLRSRFENFHIPRDSCFKILSFRTYEVQLVIYIYIHIIVLYNIIILYTYLLLRSFSFIK
jgi:hypothetical protein